MFRLVDNHLQAYSLQVKSHYREATKNTGYTLASLQL